MEIELHQTTAEYDSFSDGKKIWKKKRAARLARLLI
jgi:hypothetical protein